MVCKIQMTMSLGSFPTVRKKLCLCVLERERESEKERWSEEEIVEAEKNVEEKLSIEL